MAAVVDKSQRNEAQSEYWPLAGSVCCLWRPDIPHHSALKLVMDQCEFGLLVTYYYDRLFLMMIVPRTARRFHETLLCTTMG